MINFTIRNSFILLAMLLVFDMGFSQDNFILDKPGKLFKKKERKAQMPIKSRYFFETSPQTGREYLRQQDMLDPKGKIKSSGVFGDDGNKSGEIRYTYDASGILQKKELRKIGKNELEFTFLDKAGRTLKTEQRTKGDTLLAYTTFLYDEHGNLRESAFYNGEKLIGKKICEDIYNEKGKQVQRYHYETDSSGQKKPDASPFLIFEYDDNGMILQTTTYKDQNKRKMLDWIYFKYQLDNDYKIIKQSGYNEEQNEVSRVELTYTDSSISEAVYQATAGKMEKKSSRLFVYNTYGELITEKLFDGAGQLTQTSTFRYDDFGNRVDTIVEKTAEPGKINRSKLIIEVYADQAKIDK